ncbi:MAG TPA: hypothetical protein VF727_12020 [Allosphingosinicella sp.]
MTGIVPFAWFAAAILIGLGGCAARPGTGDRRLESRCPSPSIQQLSIAPAEFAGRRVCVSGFLARMPEYGESSAELYATEEEAKEASGSTYVTIGVPITIHSQQQLARHSARPIRVDGVFGYDEECWPRKGEKEPEYQCFPPRPMNIRNARILFSDGTEMP